MKTLIIIPTYNEAQNISSLILEIFKYLADYDFSILIVDDSSVDGTVDEIRKLNKNNIYIIKRPSKLGLASAYVDGFKYGLEQDYDIFIQLDADLSHNPKYLPCMINKLNQYDVVIASRNIKGGCVEGWSFIRNFISKAGSLYSRMILSCPIKDFTGGFNCWKRSVIEKIGLDNIISKGYCFQIEMKYKAYLQGAKITEIPIIFADRKAGKSKMDKKILFEAIINPIKFKFNLKKI